MMRHWREREFERHLSSKAARYGLGIWAFFARRPWLYRLAARVGIGILGKLGAGKGRFRRLPLAGGWTEHRDFPAPESRTFHQQWRKRSRPQ
jgi:L-lactate dehydrogenase complex protein LldF